MAKTYFPTAGSAVDIEASKPHPANTVYRVSSGLEEWDDGNHAVVKVQMVYDGVIHGRRSPSYPIGTNDLDRVAEACRKVAATVR